MSASLQAQTPISFGETKVNLGMVAAQNTPFSFAATAGQIISIQMTETEGDFNPAFDLLGPSGAILTTVRDVSSAILARFTIPGTGSYLLICRDDTGNYGGSYNVTLIDCLGQNAADNDSGALISGQTKLATMVASDLDVFSFSGEAGELATIQITETAGDFNPTLDLLSPNGSLVQSATNVSSARLALVSLPVSGTYFILCRDSLGIYGGSYNLSLTVLKLDDGDNDNLPDSWERQYFGDLRYTPEGDPDEDRLKNGAELERKTHPGEADTDGDTFKDGSEVALGSDPLNPASKPSQGIQIFVKTVDVEFAALAGFEYQLQASDDFTNWVHLGPAIQGDNTLFRTNIEIRGTKFQWFVAPAKAAP